MSTITTITTIRGVQYAVKRPLHAWDMNYHFMPVNGHSDYLVDLQDVIDYYKLEDGATVDNAINYVKEFGKNAFWKVNK